jgi:molybdopterin/thiamine biosynthesis adenylyltransferase
MERYSRHIVLKKIGTAGQKRLLGARVLVAGAGGLGSPAALYLAAAGVGTIGIADGDVVELSNLQRQILYRPNDVGGKKAESASRILADFNPDVRVDVHDGFLTTGNIMDVIAPYDFILDGTDNLSSKFLINDACVTARKPFTFAGIGSFGGQMMTCIPGKGPCCRCVFGEPEKGAPNRRGGVVGAVCGVMGSLQAMEAIKFILGIGQPLAGRMLVYDALSSEFKLLRIPSVSDDCPLCGRNRPLYGRI